VVDNRNSLDAVSDLTESGMDYILVGRNVTGPLDSVQGFDPNKST